MHPKLQPRPRLRPRSHKFNYSRFRLIFKRIVLGHDVFILINSYQSSVSGSVPAILIFSCCPITFRTVKNTCAYAYCSVWKSIDQFYIFLFFTIEYTVCYTVRLYVFEHCNTRRPKYFSVSAETYGTT